MANFNTAQTGLLSPGIILFKNSAAVSPNIMASATPMKILNPAKDRKNKVIIQTPKSTYGIRSDSIIYIEAADKYSILHTVHQNIVIHKSIGYLASVLPDFFCRIHRSYLINCHHVSKVERYYVTLVTGETLPIPEKRYTEVYHNVMQAMQ